MSYGVTYMMPKDENGLEYLALHLTTNITNHCHRSL